MLLDLLEDLFEDIIFKGIRNVYEHLSDYALFHPRLAAAGKVLLFLLVTLGGTAWFAFRAVVSREMGKSSQMQIYLASGAVYLIFCIFVGLRGLLRWYKLRKERMDGPRYQR